MSRREYALSAEETFDLLDNPLATCRDKFGEAVLRQQCPIPDKELIAQFFVGNVPKEYLGQFIVLADVAELSRSSRNPVGRPCLIVF